MLYLFKNINTLSNEQVMSIRSQAANLNERKKEFHIYDCSSANIIKFIKRPKKMVISENQKLNKLDWLRCT